MASTDTSPGEWQRHLNDGHIQLVAASILLMFSDSIMGAFTVVSTITVVLFLVVWARILVSYIVYLSKHPEAHARSACTMPGGRFMPYVVLVFFVFVLHALTGASDPRQAMIWTPRWFVLHDATTPATPRGMAGVVRSPGQTGQVSSRWAASQNIHS